MNATPDAFESLVATKIREVVEDWVITKVPEDDDSRVDVVIVGKPTRELRNNMVVSVHMDHPFGPRMDKDTEVSGVGGSLSPRPYRFPGETLGGCKVDEVIGCVQIRARTREAAEDASKVVAPVKARIKRAIDRDHRLRRVTDGLGNYMFYIQTFRAIGYESGGGQVTINSQWVDFRALISRSNCRDL